MRDFKTNLDADELIEIFDSSFNESNEYFVEFNLVDTTPPKITVKDVNITDTNLEEYDINENTVYDEINKAFKIKNYTEEKLQRKQEELFKMVNLSESLLQRKINTLSDTEKIKIYFSKKLINNNDEIIIDDFFYLNI